jgi:hypothetical protein
MKMLMIVYADYYDGTITDAFAGYKTYLKLHEATGKREQSEARLGTHSAPGKNKCIFIPVLDEEIPRLLDIVRRLKEKHPTVVIGACTFQLEEYI